MLFVQKKKKRTASDTELKQITLTTDTAGEARCKALCAKKGKGPRNLPMDEEYMFDPRIPQLKKRHKVRAAGRFEENHKRISTKNPASCTS